MAHTRRVVSIRNGEQGSWEGWFWRESGCTLDAIRGATKGVANVSSKVGGADSAKWC